MSSAALAASSSALAASSAFFFGLFSSEFLLLFLFCSFGLRSILCFLLQVFCFRFLRHFQIDSPTLLLGNLSPKTSADGTGAKMLSVSNVSSSIEVDNMVEKLRHRLCITPSITGCSQTSPMYSTTSLFWPPLPCMIAETIVEQDLSKAFGAIEKSSPSSAVLLHSMNARACVDHSFSTFTSWLATKSGCI